MSVDRWNAGGSDGCIATASKLIGPACVSRVISCCRITKTSQRRCSFAEDAVRHIARKRFSVNGTVATDAGGGGAKPVATVRSWITPVYELFVQPAAGDNGTDRCGAVGAASALGQPRRFGDDHAYTGPTFSGRRLSGCAASAVGRIGGARRTGSLSEVAGSRRSGVTVSRKGRPADRKS